MAVDPLPISASADVLVPYKGDRGAERAGAIQGPDRKEQPASEGFSSFRVRNKEGFLRRQDLKPLPAKEGGVFEARLPLISREVREGLQGSVVCAS